MNTFAYVFDYLGVGEPEKYVHECNVWQEVVDEVEEEPRLTVDCAVNQDCTGFDCKGNYTYNVSIHRFNALLNLLSVFE